MTHTLQLGQASLNLDDYAIQGNAMFGIKESGKTYAATYMAERLMDAGIPIVAFDPIGVWRYLRVPGAGRGYPVVVAGDSGDLPLTPATAPQIVQAAQQAGISLVIDLYSSELSKADWRRIVTDCLRTLFYRNADYGPRHVFLEEAPEFCPQRVGASHAQVYAEVEKLARMGGNVYLGYTLVGQRAEEINKAVLEICDGLLLFRQKGKNSLASVKKWLDLGGATNQEKVLKSIPMLPAGECWVWGRASDKPALAQVPTKQSFHPDRRNRTRRAAAGQAVSVSAFVDQMQKLLRGDKVSEHGIFNPNVPAGKPVQIVKFPQPIVVKEDEHMDDKQFEQFLKQQQQQHHELLAAVGRSATPSNGTPSYTRLELDDIYNYVLERLKGEAPALLLQLTQQKPAIELAVERVVVELDTTTLRGKIVKLATDGFFTSAKNGNQVTNELLRLGQRAFPKDVYDELKTLAEQGVFTVEKLANRTVVYTLAPDVQITRKER